MQNFKSISQLSKLYMPQNQFAFNYQKFSLLNRIPKFRIFNVKNSVKELPENLKQLEKFEQGHKDIPNPVHKLVRPGKEKLIGSWLLLSAGGVFFMVVLGGYTRLTNSGLSMTKWKPIQHKMPQSDEEWNEEFEHYKLFPEYQIQNKNMDVEGFKKIFFVEWFHRFVGSSLGVVFTLPFAYFLYRGHIKAPFRNRLFALLGLGGSQGLIGWWMVKSGMNEKPDYQSKPRVSVYRLLVHLNTALVIYGGLLWNGLTLIRKPQELLLKPEHLKGNKTLRFLGIMLLHCIALNTLSGACVAGIDAGKVFNDWPFYNGQLLPPNMMEKIPAIKNIFENRGTVQFNHRTFGYLTFTVGLITLLKGRKLNLMRHQRIYLYIMFGLISLQVANGIATLLHGVKPMEANAHQMMAICVLTSAILMTHSARKPSKLYGMYLNKFIV